MSMFYVYVVQVPKRAICQYWNWHSHFQYWHPFPVLSFFGFHFRKFSIWYGTQTRNLTVLVLGGRDSFVPFPVLGSASSGTVIHWAPYRNWTLCIRSHFRYGAPPVPVRSFTGPRTATELCAVGKPVGGFVGSARIGVGLLTCDGRDGIQQL